MNVGRTVEGTRALLLVALAVVVVAALLGSACSSQEPPARTGGGVSKPPTSTPPPPLGLPVPTPVEVPRAGKLPAPVRGTYLGVYTPPAPFEPGRVDAFERSIGKSASIIMWYQPWAANNRSRVDTGAIVAMMRRGKVPMISWEPWDTGSNARAVKDPANQAAYRLVAINRGEYDPYIRQWARSLRAIGGPIMLRPMHEMNGRWYPWSGTTNGNSPAQFIAAWRRMHRIFQEEGATNVTWVWSINHESLPATKSNGYASYYPGDAYVDWTGISGFNGATSPRSKQWRLFGQRFKSSLAYLRTLKKPIVIAEIASLGNGPDKAAWIADAFATLRKTPEVKGIVYFDSNETRTFPENWRVDSSKESLAAFREAAAPSFFMGSVPPVLYKWAHSLSAEEWRFLLAFDPLY